MECDVKMTDSEKRMALEHAKEVLVVNVTKLMLKSTSNKTYEVGNRYMFKLGPYYKCFDCGIDMVRQVEEYLKGFTHKDCGTKTGKIKNNQIVFDYEDKIPFLEDTEEVKDVLNYCCKLAYIDSDLKHYIREIMSDAGHGMGEDPRYDINTFSCRYWGGYGAWHNPTEYEDWDWEELDLKYGKALKKAIDNFNKKYRLNAYFSVEEKNWICIGIR